MTSTRRISRDQGCRLEVDGCYRKTVLVAHRHKDPLSRDLRSKALLSKDLRDHRDLLRKDLLLETLVLMGSIMLMSLQAI